MGAQHNGNNENELELAKFGEFLLMKRFTGVP